MDDELILLTLNKKEIADLYERGYYHIIRENNTPVTPEMFCEAKILLSRIYSKGTAFIVFSREDVELLRESKRSYYIQLHTKFCGDKLYKEVRAYIDYLKQKQAENDINQNSL